MLGYSELIEANTNRTRTLPPTRTAFKISLKKQTYKSTRKYNRKKVPNQRTKMKGLYTLEKPKSSRDLYVAEVLIQRVGCGSSPDEGLGVACCNDYNGLDMIVDGHYSPFLKQYMSKEVFQQIEQDVNGDLEYAKEKVKKGRQALQCAVGVLILPLVLLIMLSGGATMVGTCQKNSQDKKRVK